MAIAFDAKTDPNENTDTFAHACTGANRLLIVIIALRDADADTVDGVTYDGVPMTLLSTQASGDAGCDLWYLVAPSTGSDNVVVDTTSIGDDFHAYAASFTGIDQTTPVDRAYGESGDSANASETITPTCDNSLIIGGLGSEEDDLATGAGEIELFARDDGTWGSAASYDILTDTTPQALNFVHDSDTWGLAAGCFKPVQIIYVDDYSDGSGAANPTFSIVHTAAGTVRLAVISVAVHDSNPANRPVTGVTYDGNACTQIDVEDTGAGTSEAAELWYILAPTTTAGATVEVTCTGNVANVSIGVITFKHSDSANIFALDTFNSANGSSDNSGVQLTCGQADCVYVDILSAEPNIAGIWDGQTEWAEEEPESYRTMAASWSGQMDSGITHGHQYWHAYGARWRMVIGSFYLTADVGAEALKDPIQSSGIIPFPR